jgi:hypothetical protein
MDAPPTKYTIVIENRKGSYKSFDTDSSYPLKGVTYPVDYGYIKGYTGEDGDPLDAFVGSGKLFGYITVWRNDVPTETKMFLNLTDAELDLVKKEFAPVLTQAEILQGKSFAAKLASFVTVHIHPR